jgi:hypothetical protein
MWGNVDRRGRVSETFAAPNRNASYGDSIMAKKEIRPIRIEGNLAYVPLTRGYEAVIDAVDVPLVQEFNWCAMIDKSTVYAKRGAYDGGKHRTVLMHRVIMGDPESLDIDHRDGNGLNNRRHGGDGNLRVATKAQNARNKGRRRDNASGVKGVYWHKSAGKWAAQIRMDGTVIWSERFNCKTAAAIAYAKASRVLHGEFGRIA